MDGKNGLNVDPSLAEPAKAAAPLRVKTLKCSGCGHSLIVRGMDRTEAVACEACGSILDLTDESLRILSVFQSKIKHRPLIPLGSRGKIRGDLLEVIGYLRRAVTVEGVDYEWSEYLLFNPYKGFRWLSEYNGHWTFLKTATNIPKKNDRAKRGSVKYLDRTFLHFQTAEARVVYVLGEFYWKVQAGEKCRATDYIDPPLILSREETDQEIVWSAGEYLEGEALWEAFRPPSPMPARIGVAPSQPSPYAGQTVPLFKLFGLFCLAALAIHLGFLLFSQDRQVFEQGFAYRKGSPEKAVVTEFFEVRGRPSNVVVKTASPLNNNWLYLSMALISEEGKAYDFGREISFYQGTEGGSAWSEGSVSDEAVLPAVPPGRYYLRIEPESSSPAADYRVRVFRDVPQWSFFLLALGALCLLPLLVFWRSRRFESARWAESDHPR